MDITENKMETLNIIGTQEWNRLRSEIYIRDRGICWVCNRFTFLTDYDLGHLIDACMGGKPIYENLAVMHEYCNSIKPRHATLEEAMKWRLMPRNTINAPTNIQPDIYVANNIVQPLQYPLAKYGDLPMTYEQRKNNRDAILKYFKDRPELLSDNFSRNRIKVTQELGKQYGFSSYTIRQILLEEGLVKKQKAILQNDDIYYFVRDNLNNLVSKYNNLECPNWDKPKAMNITAYMMRIMFYIAGHPEMVDKDDLMSISKRVAQLNIPIVSLYIKISQRNNRWHNQEKSNFVSKLL